MKRLVSLDFLRGFAIFFMIIGHVSTKLYPVSTINISELSPLVLIFAGLFYLLGRQRAFFLLISSISAIFSMHRDLKNHIPRVNILRKNVLRGVLMYLLALFWETFLHPWGLFPRLIARGDLRTDLLTQVFYFDTLHIIAFGVIFSAIMFFFLTINHGETKLIRNIIIYAFCGIIIILVTPLLHQIVQLAYATSSYYTIQLTPPRDVGEFFFRLVCSALIGLQEPLFPFLATVCIGCIIGSILSQDHPSKWFPLALFFTAVVFILIGVGLFFNGHYQIDFLMEDEPTWLYLVFTGLQLIGLFMFLQFREFSPYPRSLRISKFTRMFLRWSHISLSIYILEFLDIFPRILLSWITGLDFAGFMQITSIGWTIVCIVILLAMWEGVVRLWEKGRFIGSLEWMFAHIGYRVKKESINRRDPLNIEGTIYQVEPINFVIPQLK